MWIETSRWLDTWKRGNTNSNILNTNTTLRDSQMWEVDPVDKLHGIFKWNIFFWNNGKVNFY